MKKTSSAKPATAADDPPLWMWLIRPSEWSATQIIALATLLCFATAVFAVWLAPASGALPVAKGLVVLAYVFLALAIGREVLRTFQREQR